MHLRQKHQAIVAENLCKNIRDDLYNHIQNLPFSYHKRVKTGDLIQKCTSDVDVVRRFFNGQAAEIVSIIVTVIFSFTILFSINIKLTLIAIAFYPFIFIYSNVFHKKITKQFSICDEKESDLTSLIQESLSGVRVVKAFNQEISELKKFIQRSNDYSSYTYKTIAYLGDYWGLSYLLCKLGILATVFFGIFYTRSNVISVGDFLIFITYQTQALWQIRQLGRILADYSKMTVAIDRLIGIKEQDVEDLDAGIEPELNGDIVFQNVNFCYDDAPELQILKNFSFEIKNGQTIAIIGPTGSGKSSLIQLLSRLYETNSGTITINGHNIKDISKRHLRKNIGVVLQEPFLFSKTIYENLSITSPLIDKNAIYKSCKVAAVHDVINEFDQGYDTLVGEKGVTLSGGQKQRIAIARTIVNKCPILIFDDSLSAVDAKTDKDIREALKMLGQDTTVITITQRTASAKDADVILVVDDGELVQSGTHEELIKVDGLYKRVYELQSREGGNYGRE